MAKRLTSFVSLPDFGSPRFDSSTAVFCQTNNGDSFMLASREGSSRNHTGSVHNNFDTSNFKKIDVAAAFRDHLPPKGDRSYSYQNGIPQKSLTIGYSNGETPTPFPITDRSFTLNNWGASASSHNTATFGGSGDRIGVEDTVETPQKYSKLRYVPFRQGQSSRRQSRLSSIDSRNSVLDDLVSEYTTDYSAGAARPTHLDNRPCRKPSVTLFGRRRSPSSKTKNPENDYHAQSMTRPRQHYVRRYRTAAIPNENILPPNVLDAQLAKNYQNHQRQPAWMYPMYPMMMPASPFPPLPPAGFAPSAILPIQQPGQSLSPFALSPIASRSLLTCSREFQNQFPNVYAGLCKGLIDVNRLIAHEVVIPIKEEIVLHKNAIRSRRAVSASISERLWKPLHGKFPDPAIAPKLVKRVAEYFYDKLEVGIRQAEDERSLLQWMFRFDVENAVEIRVTTSLGVGSNSAIANIEGSAFVKRRKGDMLSLLNPDTVNIDMDVVVKALFLNGGQLGEINNDPMFIDRVQTGENRFAASFINTY